VVLLLTLSLAMDNGEFNHGGGGGGDCGGGSGGGSAAAAAAAAVAAAAVAAVAAVDDRDRWRSSERQILDLTKLFLSADQIILHFTQLVIYIRQFCGIEKNKFLFFLINVSKKLYPKSFLIFIQ
jgi:hypothetical protein